jgi:hypothetical protein
VSYDINFWKQERPLPLTAAEVYGHLCRGEPVDGLARLPVDAILARLQQQFPQFDPKAKFPDVDVENGNVEFGWSDQHFRFDLRGEVPAADRNALVRILHDFGCPLYDPQVNKRYDAADGTAIGETPAFEDPTPEQKEQMEKLKADVMAMFSGQKQKRGCAGSAALFLVAIASLAGSLAWLVGGGD